MKNKTQFLGLIFFVSLMVVSSAVATAEDAIFHCPDTGVAFESAKPVVPVTNPDESIAEWRISATVFPQETTTVSAWLEAKARYTNLSTELECETKVQEAETETAFYTTATVEINPKWKNCQVVPVEGKTNKGFVCQSA